jgi:hypothetical protein
MKDTSDKYTRDLVTPRPGRPPKPGALTPAERARRYRARQKAKEASADHVADLAAVILTWPARDRARLVRLLGE